MARSLSALSPLFRCLSVALLCCLALALPAQAIPGATDKVPAASLLVPFFETGIDSGANPQDTLLVVNNYLGAAAIIHYHVWNIDGSPTSIQGNVSLVAFDSWSVAMRDLITPASAFARSQLSEGAFYRGFVTIDTVTANTGLNPKAAAFPFSAANGLEGHIYYTRLSQGSANGINMIPLEAVPASVNPLLQDFYNLDNREEIDSDARACAHQLATGVACTGDPDSPNLITRIHTRTFGSVPLNGGTRVVVFTWDPGQPNGTGGPSQICDASGACAEDYEVHLYNEAGTDVLGNPTIRLDHVVNVIEFNGEVPGWFSIWNVPDSASRLQVFAISFNSANAGVALNWDAIFEGWIVP